MRLAVIPARGGSKRIPKKNIIPFCGKPMIAYALDAARESGLFDRIHVSTDSQEIAEVVEKLGYPVELIRELLFAENHKLQNQLMNSSLRLRTFPARLNGF